MEKENTYDPFQFQNVPTAQQFSLPEKLMAIVLVFSFMTIPLYEISSDAFKANYVYKPEPSYSCATSYFEAHPNISFTTEFRQGKEKNKQ
ncbi:hypothetical protein U8527_10260 [Kordia algicida OT-1]|uniref:Uncharacterized protein n=1 Tax=Kordia algicida OT-1 TaxID=391587 RepID=A9DVZ6_9FLAO|nr:hypothetical protein [Kordia algicida]EDP96488.1 hypothetical protein KAOT1_03727 [Kordia algicida OT-1]